MHLWRSRKFSSSIQNHEPGSDKERPILIELIYSENNKTIMTTKRLMIFNSATKKIINICTDADETSEASYIPKNN